MSTARLSAVAEHAFGLARQGHWKLADALELEARAREDKTIAGIIHQGGCEAMVGFITDLSAADLTVECYDCDGQGETDCCECGHTRTCPTCDGDGVLDADTESMVASDCVRWTTLGGEPRQFDASAVRFGSFLSVEDARRMTYEWGRLASALASRPYPAARTYEQAKWLQQVAA